jgi:fatty-acyl-CoA synthase
MFAMADYLALQAGLQPGRLAARDLTTGEAWTYREFDRAGWQYAALLRRYGVAAGDRVAVLAKNRAELILLHFGCARLGAMYVPLNWRLSAPELAALVADCEPGLIIGDSQLAGAGLSGIALDAFAAEARGIAPMAAGAVAADTPSLILYTSGTSGTPKGVLLTEANIWQTALNFSLLGRVERGSVVLCDSPMFHVIGLVTNIRPALMRGGAILVSGAFVPGRTLARLADEALGVTHYFCVPQMAAMLRAEPGFDPAGLRGLTAIFSGGAPHAADAIRAWTSDGIAIADGFGMSEAGTVSCMPLDPALIEARAGSAGIIPPGVAARVVDASGAACPAGAVGELWIKGPNVTSGYWRRPKESAAALGADGWLRTGDIARIDEDGYLWLVDRRKDMFISGGENVYPAEIEAALARFPGIAECAVVGVPDARWGEVGHLAVVAAPGIVLEAAAILAHLETRVARYKIPKHVTITDALPRNGAGKLVKAQLREILA